MPNMLGTELLEFAVQNYPLQTRILLTAYSDLEALDVAINKGKICKYLKKPWNETELIECIREAYKVYQLRFEKEQIARELNETNEKLEALLKGKLGVM
jgi:response regulator RpfG family c-di-GMP phosphodiesterase